MAPPTSTATLTPAAFTEQWSAASAPRFQDLVGVATPILAPHPSPARSGSDRRERPRRRDRRSVLAVNHGAPAVVASANRMDLVESYIHLWLRPEMAMWFEDLRWGTPLARKLAVITAITCFLGFCVFVVMATFTGQAAL